MPIRDFSKSRDVKIRIDHADGTGDIFFGVPGLAAMSLIELAGEMDRFSPDEMIKRPELLPTILGMLFTDDSAQRFLARTRDKTDPIDFDQLLEVVMYMMEEYGMRPTKPSENSSDGSPSPEPGTSSTESVSQEVSTSTPLLQTVS